jgi:curved DNA-binding protein CbpA
VWTYIQALVRVYDILQVSTDAPFKDIRDSYKRLAIALHPDKNKAPDATAAFQLLNRAYETLKSESQRTTYDLILFEELSRRSLEDSKTRILMYDEKKQPRGATESNFTNFKDPMYEDFDFTFENFSDEPKSAFHPDAAHKPRRREACSPWRINTSSKALSVNAIRFSFL